MSVIRFNFNLSGKVSDASIKVSTVHEHTIQNYFGRYVDTIGTTYRKLHYSGDLVLPVNFYIIKNITKGGKLYVLFDGCTDYTCVLNYDEFILVGPTCCGENCEEILVKGNKIIKIEYIATAIPVV